jgi:hypothetical protein
MRGLSGLIGILFVLAVVGVLVKKQLGSTQQAIPALRAPSEAIGTAGAVDPQANVRLQGQQVQQQVKQAVDAMMQQPRPVPDDK